MEEDIDFLQSLCIEAILLCRDADLLDLIWKLLATVSVPISTTMSKLRTRRTRHQG